MTVLDEILVWSEQLTQQWLRDALRRLVTHESLTLADRDELYALLKYECGLLSEAPTQGPIPLSSDHLPNRIAATGPISLLRIGPLVGVNAVAPDQSISLSASGLNVIYGRNAAGKSGYARVLKKACRTRDADEAVYGNIHEREPALGQRADFRLLTGSTEVEVSWSPDAPPPETASIAVFDSRCARLYVDKAGEVAFLPYGLDVFESLCRMMDEFAGRLNEEARQLSETLPPVPDLPEGTASRAFVDALTATTDLDALEVACRFDKDSQERLAELRRQLAKNPEDEVKRLRRLGERLKSLAVALEAISNCVAGEAAKIPALRADVSAAQEAVEAASRLAFDDSPLKGVGCDAWRLMFDAAKEYSTSAAYPGEEYPFLGDDARCVLCQQPLAEDAKDRFTRFAAFVSTSTGAALQQAQQAAAACSAELLGWIGRVADLEDSLLDEVAEVDASMRTALTALRLSCQAARSQGDALFNSLDTGGMAEDIGRIPDLAVLAATLHQQSDDLAKGVDSEARASMEKEAVELESTRMLASSRDSLLERRMQLAKIAEIRKAAGTLGTTHVTRAGNKIAESAVTGELTKALRESLAELGLEDMPALVERTGGKGAFLTVLKLGDCLMKASLSDVLSEGEQRVIALAAFIAELRLAGHTSAMVFDDPVSSLDHNHRERVARSIVGLARDRQVVVFTHDIVFLKDLADASDDQGVQLTIRSVRRSSRDAVGIAGDLPQELLPLARHVESLDARRLELKVEYERVGESERYRDGVRLWYGLLREAWEKSIEETLFNKVVESFGDKVKPLRLREVAVEEEDWEAVRSAYTRASAEHQGHRKGVARDAPVPSPTDMERDLTELRTQVARMRRRRKDLDKSRRKA